MVANNRSNPGPSAMARSLGRSHASREEPDGNYRIVSVRILDTGPRHILFSASIPWSTTNLRTY